MNNNTQIAQRGLQGIYHRSSLVYNKPSWTKTSEAIWYHPQTNDWNVGYLDNIGSLIAGIQSVDQTGSQCPFDLPSEMWNYGDNGQWFSAGANEINFDCLEGNHL